MRDVLCIVGSEMDRSRTGSQKTLRFQEGSHSGPDELYMYVELDVVDMMVICKPSNWSAVAINEVHVGDVRLLPQYPLSLCTSTPQSIAFYISQTYGFLHRLDTPNSGVILTAKTYEVCHHLKFQLSVGIDTLVRD